MSFLERHDPSLFARFQRVRRRDQRLVEVFDDLESVAADLDQNAGRTAGLLVGIVAELTDELRQRVEACETKLNQGELQNDT